MDPNVIGWLNLDPVGLRNESLQSLEGHIIARKFLPGFVILSYFVSALGSWTTLELINRRTAMRGPANWFILAGASISMGGIAVWCMHFVGNRAIVLGGGEPELQIAYSAGFTVLSLFMAIGAFFMALWAVGSNDTVSIARIVFGGTLAGFAICGMHYLGQAGIANYDCIYIVPYVVGAGIIAVGACITVLLGFYSFRSMWANAWWKRFCCGIFLAVAVSSMHWLAAIGTLYRLKDFSSDSVNSFDRHNGTTILVIILSILGCITLLLITLLAQTRIRRTAKRAQQLVLGVAIFDFDGKILVTPEGQLPTRKITNSWLERSLDDVFSVAHPVFLWMFRTSRNWGGINHLLPGMHNHIVRSGVKGRFGSSSEANLLSDIGTPIEDYSVVFRELFCAAAAELAADLNQPLERVGVLFDEIIATGEEPKEKRGLSTKFSKRSAATAASSIVDLEREALGVAPPGKGSLLFLVSRVGRREAERLQGAGYRFALPVYVLPILSKSLQVKSSSLTRRLEVMKDYAAAPHILDPGVHIAIFAVRASMGVGRHGFDILARRDAKNQLPTMQIPHVNTLEDWQVDYLKEMDNKSVSQSIKLLFKAAKPNNPSPKIREFAKQFLRALETLKGEIEDPIFNDAALIATPVEAPCCGSTEGSPPGMATLIVYRIIVPIHGRAPGKKLLFIPLPFFKMSQHIYPNSPGHGIFARKTYREFAPFVDPGQSLESFRKRSRSSILRLKPIASSISMRSSKLDIAMGENIDMYGNLIAPQTPSTPQRSKTRIRFWDRPARKEPEKSEKKHLTTEMYSDDSSRGTGGIMVSQDVTMDVKSKDQSSGNSRISASPTRSTKPTGLLSPGIEMGPITPPAGPGTPNGVTAQIGNELEEMKTFVDELFAATIAKRGF